MLSQQPCHYFDYASPALANCDKQKYRTLADMTRENCMEASKEKTDFTSSVFCSISQQEATGSVSNISNHYELRASPVSSLQG